ncbi:MAG: toxin-antitoxin system HicB family antitoxin [Mesorhizobium sp.]|uniref:type II toxin-antitoxin system HicB family antitoxin n=2 Tax=Mesorhizobium TaxID=68287 RepID=UPI000FCC6254|nr:MULTISPECIES: type II toxin-antitoxin system HicB family antitoxin [unclassified Mesorhizobium]RUV39975.1 type II toxin-antitoxin system HicB family antitoxin [Mesorhizobium sp. M1A.T.Ca.IN.004.03.1.1]RWH50340.1 MAG: type II toxin-antitoxin system HicB family antitoxin [Mesorhizobium sp.]RWK28561.1 MAG: type II toxin-antitoxin system HicB family antitoxin [Mesorhizobium sp.]TIP15307.1 MAG: toxin-antitoxin system HicB family antitoxin [Mesorhizobium sp.]TJV77868.1 MAG: toxin-antitoxin system
MTVADRYPAHVFWSDDDEGFIAVAPDLPGCSAFGETREGALAELLPAIDAWIAAAQAAGNEVPKPSKPAEKQQYSGKVLLRMPKDLHARLARAAEDNSVSLNHHMVYLLASALVESKASPAADMEPYWVEGNKYRMFLSKSTSPDPAVKVHRLGFGKRRQSWSSWSEHVVEPCPVYTYSGGTEVLSTNDIAQWHGPYLTLAGNSRDG